MMCAKPFVRTGPHSVKKITALTNEDARLAVTPFGCGQCIACRSNKYREWQHRIMLEANAHESNIFFTMTYAEEERRKDKSLDPKVLCDYLKLARWHIGKFRYFAVGEYGERKNREHYHVAFFGVSPSSAPTLNRLWGKGRTHCGEVNRRSAGYIAGYVTKGWTKEDDWTKDKLKGRHPEFARMSTGSPGGLGIQMIKAIGLNILKSGQYDGRIINQLGHGSNRFPLGRYLTHKLADQLNTPEESFEVTEWARQCHNIIKHQKGDTIYVNNIIEDYDGKRERLRYLARRRRDWRKARSIRRMETFHRKTMGHKFPMAINPLSFTDSEQLGYIEQIE